MPIGFAARRSALSAIAFAAISVSVADAQLLPSPPPPPILGSFDTKGSLLDPIEKLSPQIREMLDGLVAAPSGPIEIIIQTDLPLDLRSTVATLVRLLGGTVGRMLDGIDGLSASLPLSKVLAVANLPGVTRISIDAPIRSNLDVVPGAISADQVWPSALGASGVDGKGIGICVIDSGGNKTLADFVTAGKSRVVAFQDFTGLGSASDAFGHGVHVTAIAAGNGSLSKGGNASYCGVAPGASIVTCRVLDGNGVGKVSNVIAAIDWAIANKTTYNIRVVNLSLGHPVFESFYTDPLTRACAVAVKKGIVVVAAAGNNGSSDGVTVYGGIHSPGNAPWVIGVGSVDTGESIFRSDDDVSWFSSRGPTAIDGQIKPDLVAPGRDVVSLLQPQCRIAKDHPELIVRAGSSNTASYLRLSGTSMATPVVSGIVALVLQANSRLSPNAVKAVLMYTAQKMTEPNLLEQGAGYVNAEGAVRLARAIDARVTQDDASWKLYVVEPCSTIANEVVLWGSSLVYGRTVLWGGNVDNPSGRPWGDGFVWDDGILWNRGGSFDDSLSGVRQKAYGESILWRSAETGAESILWRHTLSWTGASGSGQDLLYGKWLGPLWVGRLVDPDSTRGTGLFVDESAPPPHFEYAPIDSEDHPPKVMTR